MRYLFVAGAVRGNIYEFTPGGAQSIFASRGGSIGSELAFNSTGDLFESGGGGYITEFAPDRTPSTFSYDASGFTGLAFQGETLPVPEPSAMALLAVGATAIFARRR